MTFVNEAVPEDRKSSFDPTVFYDPKSGWMRRPITLYRWVRDYERDVFFIRLGGGGPWEGGDAPRPREYLALSWQGEVVKFEALCDATGSAKDNSVVIRWEVLDIHVPIALVSKREMIKGLIEEGLDAMGNSICHREGVRGVNVHFK